MPIKNDDLFKISKLVHNDNIINARLDINKASGIFNGHFPGHPVVPGACMLQVVKEVLEKALGTPLLLKKADHLKFMAMIDPGNTQAVNLEASYKFVEHALNVNAKLSDDTVVCFKFQGSFVCKIVTLARSNVHA